MIKGLSLVNSISRNPIDHHGTKSTFHNLMKHDPHPGQVPTRDRVAGERERKNPDAEGYNSLFSSTFCLVTDPVNESPITRRRPGFDIQVDPVSVVSDRDPRCGSSSKPRRAPRRDPRKTR
jgi:hypothetical protein